MTFFYVPSNRTISSNPKAKFSPGEHSLESNSNALLPQWNQYISLSLLLFFFLSFFNLLALLIAFLLTMRSHCIISLLSDCHICFGCVCLEPAEESSIWKYSLHFIITNDTELFHICIWPYTFILIVQWTLSFQMAISNASLCSWCSAMFLLRSSEDLLLFIIFGIFSAS